MTSTQAPSCSSPGTPPGGSLDATAADLTAAHDDGLALTVIAPVGDAALRVALPDGPEPRARIAALLEQVRARLPPRPYR
jgi:hypothetical protein